MRSSQEVMTPICKTSTSRLVHSLKDWNSMPNDSQSARHLRIRNPAQQESRRISPRSVFPFPSWPRLHTHTRSHMLKVHVLKHACQRIRCSLYSRRISPGSGPERCPSGRARADKPTLAHVLKMHQLKRTCQRIRCSLAHARTTRPVSP
jgi:hypothetical protein